MVGSVPLKRLGTVLGPPHPHRSTFNDAIDPKGEHSASHGERRIPEPAIPVEPTPPTTHILIDLTIFRRSTSLAGRIPRARFSAVPRPTSTATF